MAEGTPSNGGAARRLKITQGTDGALLAAHYSASCTLCFMGQLFKVTHITPEDYERLDPSERPRATVADDGPGYFFTQPL